MGKTKKPKERSVHYNRAVGVIYITVDGKESAYYLDHLATDIHGSDVRAYRLTPFACTRRPDQPEHYDVTVGPTVEHSECECWGFLRHKYCKHTQALVALRAAGKLT